MRRRRSEKNTARVNRRESGGVLAVLTGCESYGAPVTDGGHL
jgi:hypothetical protein